MGLMQHPLIFIPLVYLAWEVSLSIFVIENNIDFTVLILEDMQSAPQDHQTPQVEGLRRSPLATWRHRALCQGDPDSAPQHTAEQLQSWCLCHGVPCRREFLWTRPAREQSPKKMK